MSLKELWKFLWQQATEETVMWLVIFLVVSALVSGVIWLKGEVNAGHETIKQIKSEHALRENWCYEKGYFEVVHLEKLNKGYICVDARDTTEIRTLVIPPEVSER